LTTASQQVRHGDNEVAFRFAAQIDVVQCHHDATMQPSSIYRRSSVGGDGVGEAHL